MTRRIGIVVLGMLLVLGFAVPGVASAAVYGHTCWAQGRVCGSVNQSALADPIIGVGAVHNSSGRICITGVALYVNGTRDDDTLRQFPNGVCAPSGGTNDVQVQTGGYRTCDGVARTFQVHVTYVISGKAMTQGTPPESLHGPGTCSTG